MNNELTVRELVKQINDNRTQASASTKDETRVMKAMLNDPTYVVDVYGKSGVEGQYCPYEDARKLVSTIIKDTTKVTSQEANELARRYEFSTRDANIMIGISKEFANTYLETGRKLPLGGREKSDIAIARKTKSERVNSFPKKVGVDSEGKDIYEVTGEGIIPEHYSLKVYSSCPAWVK